MSQLNDQAIALNSLKENISGNIFLPGDPGYEQARKIWNDAVNKKPAIIVLPENTEEVAAAVRFAEKQHLPLSVRAGGHDWAGKALNNDGLLINLSRMNSITIDVEKKTATVGAGIIIKEFILAVEKHHLIAATSAVGKVGLAGFTLGGGYSPFSASYGLGADNLLEAEVVLADGSIVTANKDQNPNLFWALRGGGGNFGVVTSMKIQLYDARTIVAATLMFKSEDAAKLLTAYNQIMENAPDELGALAGFMTGEDHNPVFCLFMYWNGSGEESDDYVVAIKALENALTAEIGEVKFSQLIEDGEAIVVDGRQYYFLTLWIKEFTEHDIAAITDSGNNMTSPFSVINIHHLHGEAARVPAGETAFGFREPHYMVEIVAGWEQSDEANSADHRQWADRLFDVLGKNAVPGGYANLLAADNDQQARHAFGGNLSRLRAVKAEYDKGNVFKGLNILHSGA